MAHGARSIPYLSDRLCETSATASQKRPPGRCGTSFDAAALRVISGQHAPAPKSQISELAETYVSVAYQRRNWAEVVRRWHIANPALINRIRAMVEFGTALGHLKKYDEAEIVLREVIDTDPGNASAFIELARVAKAKGDPDMELSVWEAMATKLPGHLASYSGFGNALSERRRFDEAETYLDAAMAQFATPIDLVVTDRLARQLAVTRAKIAHDRVITRMRCSVGAPY